jgi:hypothetical protein
MNSNARLNSNSASASTVNGTNEREKKVFGDMGMGMSELERGEAHALAPWLCASANDVAAVDFELPIAGSKTADCGGLFEVYRSAAQKSDNAQGVQDTPEARVFNMLWALTSMHFKPNEPNDPFGPMMSLADGRRSAIPTDFRGEPLEVVAWMAERATNLVCVLGSATCAGCLIQNVLRLQYLQFLHMSKWSDWWTKNCSPVGRAIRFLADLLGRRGDGRAALSTLGAIIGSRSRMRKLVAHSRSIVRRSTCSTFTPNLTQSSASTKSSSLHFRTGPLEGRNLSRRLPIFSTATGSTYLNCARLGSKGMSHPRI